MNILYLCNEYPPYIHGGIGSFTRDIAEGMVTIGNHVTVWGLYQNIDSSYTEWINGVEVIRERYTPTVSRLNSLNFIVKFNFFLRRFLKSHFQFDIIECQEWQGLLPFGLNHPNIVIRLHGAAIFFDSLLNRSSGKLVRWSEINTIKRAKNLVAVSQYCGEKTLEIANISKPFTVIHNAIKSSRITKFTQKGYKRHQIVFANSLLPKKGVFELASAFNFIADKYQDAELVYIGKTNYSKNGINIRDLITQRVDSSFRNRLTILGWLESSDDVYRWLSGAHVCIYPSHMEGFGIAPVESMILSKPTIFMENGPGPEVIENGVSGLLVNTRDPSSIFNAIDRIFNEPDLASSLGIEANKRAIKLFDLESVFIPTNINYYKSLLE